MPPIGVVEEDALLDRDLFFLPAACLVAGAVRIPDLLARARAHELLVAVVSAVLVALGRAIQPHGPGPVPPGAPEADVTAVEGVALAEVVEGFITGFIRDLLADADQCGEMRAFCPGHAGGQVNAAQGRGLLVVEAGEHHLAVRRAGWRGGAEDLIRAGNFCVRVVGDQHHADSCRHRVQSLMIHVNQLAVEHPGLADVIHRVVALEHDGVAAGHRGRPGEHVEHGRRIEARHLEEWKVRHAPSLLAPVIKSSEGIGVDARCAYPGLVLLSTHFPNRLVIPAGSDGVRQHVDAREGRRLDEFGLPVIRFRNKGRPVENSGDGAWAWAVWRCHVASVNAVDRLVASAQPLITTGSPPPLPPPP